MPHLALDTTRELSPDDRRACMEALTDRYTEEMATTPGYVAVTLREHPPASMSLGRAVDGPLAVLNADVRRGRPFERRREFVLSAIDWLERQPEIPRRNVKVAFTEHEGDQMMGADRVGGEWEPE